ncbi:flavodoxin family protein, partial [Streptomyces sp. NPDC006356]
MPSPSDVRDVVGDVVERRVAPEIENVEVVRRPALSATASDVLAADAYVL